MSEPTGDNSKNGDVPAKVGEGIEELGGVDLLVPYLLLAQPTTRERRVEPGDWYLSVNPQRIERPECILVKAISGNQWFDKARGRKMMCWSYDRMAPSGRSPDPQHLSCHGCPRKARIGKNLPECGESIHLLLVHTSNGMPCWYTARSTSLPVVRRILSYLHVEIRNGANLYDSLLIFDSQQAAKGSDVYWVPQISVIWQAESGKYRGVWEQYRTVDPEVTFDQGDETESSKESGGDFDWETGKRKGEGMGK